MLPLVSKVMSLVDISTTMFGLLLFISFVVDHCQSLEVCPLRRCGVASVNGSFDFFLVVMRLNL